MDITPKEAGQILDCSNRWILELLKQNKVTGRKLTNRQWLVDRESVLKFKKQKESEQKTA